MNKAEQLISISATGGIQSLDFKNRGIAINKLGRARIERTTEIEWNEDYQAWYIRFLRLGEFSGRILDSEIAELSDLPAYLRELATVKEGVLLFNDYDLSVVVEIVVIQSLRKKNLV